ncbi:MAG: DUF58 domain-containing protein [Planctomycetes bacterium]|nr:DUF58 domain-containing protein [Planctomycetota bacterium]MCB9909095.1 DUF58 domain-containing protein [Planctomycetota bacterium]MCB9911655.1 DUF58 domain-containing protein [Planctomycetota bacterium]
MVGMLEPVEPLNTRRYLLAIRKLADTLSYGTDRSRFLGSGVEYVQSRPYAPGDPVRSIDWRVTARTGTVHIKEFEAPKCMPAWILLDTSASMMIHSTALSKYALATFVAGGLALACLDRVSPVGLLGTGERELRVQPSLSKDQVLQWMIKLRQFRYDEGTSLARKVTELHTSLKSRALVIVLSDLHESAAISALKLLGQTHEVVAIQVQDPAELGFPGSGFLRAQEAETGETFTTHGRRTWTDPLKAQQALRRAGVDHLLLRTDQPVAQKVRHFFASRGLLTGGGR